MSSGVHVFRFSLSALFGMVLFAAFGTAAIRFAGPLWIGGTHVTDGGLIHFREMTALRSLDLSRTQVTDAGVAEIQKALPKCKITQ